MAPKRILLVAGDYVEDYEVMVPFQALGGHIFMRSVQVREPGNSCAPPSTTSKATRPTVKSVDTISCSTPPSRKERLIRTKPWSSPAGARRNDRLTPLGLPHFWRCWVQGSKPKSLARDGDPSSKNCVCEMPCCFASARARHVPDVRGSQSISTNLTLSWLAASGRIH
jgi:hypothetical protein